MNVIITGVTKGIGRAIANAFASAGYSVAGCARTPKDLQEFKEDLELHYPNVAVATKAVNIANEEEIKSFGRWVLEEGLTPDVIVNNAGFFVPGTIYEEEDGTIDKMMAANVYSAYHLCRALIPAMIERKRGHIFNICSVAAIKPMANVGSYGISKFALYGMTKHLREEMKPFGVKVTAILPGSTFSGSWEGSGVDPQRIIDADDIAQMILVSSQLSPRAVVEDIVLRPQLGDF